MVFRSRPTEEEKYVNGSGPTKKGGSNSTASFPALSVLRIRKKLVEYWLLSEYKCKPQLTSDSSPQIAGKIEFLFYTHMYILQLYILCLRTFYVRRSGIVCICCTVFTTQFTIVGLEIHSLRERIAFTCNHSFAQ